MKKNYMYQLYWCLIFTFTLFLKMNAQSPGDIAFIAFNADGNDDFAVVVLADLAANSTIYITDNESDGAGGITSGEGTLTWSKNDIHYFQGKFSMELIQKIHQKEKMNQLKSKSNS